MMLSCGCCLQICLAYTHCVTEAFNGFFLGLHLHAFEKQFCLEARSNLARRDVTSEITRKYARKHTLAVHLAQVALCFQARVTLEYWAVLRQPFQDAWVLPSTVYSALHSSERRTVGHYFAMLQPSFEGEQSPGDRLEACDASLYITAKVKLLWDL